MKTKSILLLFITLCLGFILGMLTSAQIRFNRLKPVRLYFSEERFREGFYKIIEPDEKQKAEIEKILDKFAKLSSTLQSDFRKSYESNMKEFRKELDSKLTKDQLARLKELDERREEMIRRGWRDRNDSTGSRNFRRFDRRGPQFDRQSHNFDSNMPGQPHEGFRPPIPPYDSSASPDRE